MFKILIFISLILSNINPANAVSDTNTNQLELSQGWQFCPTESYLPNIDISKLKCYPIEVPKSWESVIPDYDGFGLLYKKFHVPQSMSNHQLGFYAKQIRDANKVFINNILIGKTGEFPPNFDKAIFNSSLYAIPLNIIKFNLENTIKVWVYNDARPGGIRSSIPIIANYKELVSKQYNRNYITFAFIIVLLLFSLINFINAAFNLKALENIYFGLFLLAWAIYLFTSTDIVLLTNFSFNSMFRLNVMMFFTTYPLFFLFIYSFFKQPIPLSLKVIIAISLTFIPFCIILPEPNQLYTLITIIELSAIPALLVVIWLLIKANKDKLPYAHIMSAVSSFYIIYGLIEIAIDYIVANEASTYNQNGPWPLLILSLVLTLIVGHKNMMHLRKATFDGLTGVLRFENFTEKLNELINHSKKHHQSIAILMVDLDDFKQINDNHGHIQGDKILVLASKVMQDELNNHDLLARYGGDEFCLAVIRNNPEELKIFIHNLHNKLNKLTLDYNNNKISVRTTIGVSILQANQPINEPESLVEDADNLLIKAKATNKGEISW